MRAQEFIVESVDFEQMQPQNIVAVAQQAFAQLYPGVKLYGRSVVEGVGLTTAKGQAGAASAFAGGDTVRGAFYLTLNAYAEGDSMIVVIEDATAGQYKGAATAIIKSLFEAGERLYQTEQRELVINDNANVEAWSVIADRVGAEMMESTQLAEVVTQDFFNANFNEIDSIITKKHPKQILDLLLGMFPTAKEAIVNQYNDEDGMPFSEWRRVIYDIGNYVLSGPVVISGAKLPIDPESEADRLAKYQQYIKDKDAGRPAQYFRANDSDPRTIDFTKLPPITIAQTDKGLEVVDGNHRAFLAKMANKPLRAYVWKRQTNNHPNVAKIKALFSTQQKLSEEQEHNFTTAYHITTEENAEEIDAIGLRPKEGNVYLVVDEGDPKKLRDELSTVAGWIYARTEQSDEELNLLKIDISDIPLTYRDGWYRSLVPISADRIENLGSDPFAGL
jgi:hypothetical protein